MPETKQITLPVTGMTCANCVATIERNLKKVDGVQVATVNLSSERATVEFDPARTNLDGVIGRIQKAGYDVATGEADLLIRRMSDDNDARRLEKALNQIEGVRDVQVSFATGTILGGVQDCNHRQFLPRAQDNSSVLLLTILTIKGIIWLPHPPGGGVGESIDRQITDLRQE